MTDSDRLRLYLHSVRSREEHREDIESLLGKDDSLLELYHQETGRIDSRALGRKLREIGLGNAWFAMLNGTIIASGSTREKLEENLHEILPAEKQRFAYFFYLKAK